MSPVLESPFSSGIWPVLLEPPSPEPPLRPCGSRDKYESVGNAAKSLAMKKNVTRNVEQSRMFR